MRFTTQSIRFGGPVNSEYHYGCERIPLTPESHSRTSDISVADANETYLINRVIDVTGKHFASAKNRSMQCLREKNKDGPTRDIFRLASSHSSNFNTPLLMNRKVEC